MRLSQVILSLCVLFSLAACGEQPGEGVVVGAGGGHMTAPAAADYPRGPHNGRLLESGDFVLEMTVFETGVPPEYRVYPYLDGAPLDPAEVQLQVVVSRLGGRIDQFTFAAENDYLRGQSVLIEPHSFDVAVDAQFGGSVHSWNFESHEGRTTIARDVADAAGVAVEAAGPGVIEETIKLSGIVELLPEGRAEIRAWYPGRIVSMTKVVGDSVAAGEVIARVESAESLQTYSIPAPFAGVIAERNGAVGSVAGDAPIYVLMDPTKLHAEFFLFPRDGERIREGQAVAVNSATGDVRFDGTVEFVLFSGDGHTPVRIAHVEIPEGDTHWWPGMAIEGRVVVGSEPVPLVVRTRALQRFRDFTVVYARFGDTYEVRMLELGRQTPEWTEILGGLEPGTEYVTDNAFLIRADVEKAGAAHDH
jgi:cobalt-zinc-cadmium efflux system membrane fusion protein